MMRKQKVPRSSLAEESNVGQLRKKVNQLKKILACMMSVLKEERMLLKLQAQELYIYLINFQIIMRKDIK